MGLFDFIFKNRFEKFFDKNEYLKDINNPNMDYREIVNKRCRGEYGRLTKDIYVSPDEYIKKDALRRYEEDKKSIGKDYAEMARKKGWYGYRW